MTRIFKSFRYAFNGIKYNFKTQRNFRIHCLGFMFMNLSAFYFEFLQREYLICLILSGFVFFAELLNTAIESVVDLTTKEHHELAKIAKDCAAGAVLVIAILTVIVWTVFVFNH